MSSGQKKYTRYAAKLLYFHIHHELLFSLICFCLGKEINLCSFLDFSSVFWPSSNNNNYILAKTAFSWIQIILSYFILTFMSVSLCAYTQLPSLQLSTTDVSRTPKLFKTGNETHCYIKMEREGNEMACSFTSRHCYIKFKKFHTVNIICYLTGEQNEWKSDLLCSLLFPIALMLKILMGTLLRLFVLWSIHLYNNTSVCKYL